MINVYLSMDCERVWEKEIGMKGPASIIESAMSILDFAKLAESHNQIVEFFITPQSAELHAPIFQDLATKGHILSLHLHLPSYKEEFFGQKIELGNLSAEKQFQILKSAVNDFENFLEQKPCGFRPGMGSANAETFEILTKLGIHSGSVTIPDLVEKRYKTDWTNWSKEPHTVKTEDGDFHNKPLTGNLWIDNIKRSENLPDVNLKTANYLPIYTHNWVDFSENSFAYRYLNDILTYIEVLEKKK